MKKIFLLSAAVFSLSATLFAASTPPPMSFGDLRDATVSQTREKTLKTGKLTYQIFDGNNKPVTTMTVWVEKPSKVRINIQKTGDEFAAGWDGKEKPWACDRANGVYPLSEEGQKIFYQDIHFFPVITPAVNFSKGLEPESQELYDGIECNVYRATTAEGFKKTYRFFVAEKTSLVCKLVTEEDGIPTVFSLRGYCEIDGVKLPSRISISGAEGSRTFCLVTAKFDVAIPEGIFLRPEGFQSCNFGPGEILPAVAPRKKVVTEQAAIEKQRLLVKQLEIQIKTEKEKMAKMESLYAHNQENAIKLRSTSDVRYRSWCYWGYSSGYSSNRSAARRMEKQNDKIGKEYQASVRKVTDLELKLVEAQEKLAQMTATE